MSNATLTTNASVVIQKDSPVLKHNKYRSHSILKYIYEFIIFILFLPVTLSIVIAYFINFIVRLIWSVFHINNSKTYFKFSIVETIYYIVLMVIFLFIAFIIFYDVNLWVHIDSMSDIAIALNMPTDRVKNILGDFIIIAKIFNTVGNMQLVFTSHYVSYLILWYTVDLTIFFIPFIAAIAMIFILIFDEVLYITKSNDYITMLNKVKKGDKYVKPRYKWKNRIAFWIWFNFLWKMYRRIEENELIEKHRLTPKNGQIISFIKNQQVFFPIENWSKHCLFIGGKKSGKSNNIISWLVSGLYNMCPIIYLDSTVSDDNLQYFKKLSYDFNVPFYSWNTDAQKEMFLKYSPFVGKTSKQACDIIEYSFLKKSTNSSLKKLVRTILEFMVINNIKINFKNLEMYTSLNILSNTFTSSTDTSENYHEIKIIIAEAMVDSKHLLHVLNSQIKLFNSKIAPIISDEENENNISFANIIKAKIPCLYVNFSKTFSPEFNGLLQRIFYKDMMIMLNEYNLNVRNKNILWATSNIHNLYNDQNDILQEMKIWQKNKLCVGIDVVSDDEKNINTPVYNELINNIPTVFIHRITNTILYEKIKDILKKTRLVEPFFEFVDLNNKFSSLYVHDEPTLSATEEEKKNELIANLKHVNVSEFIFKTFYVSHSVHSHAKENSYNIFYNKYIRSPLVIDYMNYAQKQYISHELTEEEYLKIKYK